MDPNWRERSDAELLRASAAEPEAFGVFYDRHAAAVLAFLARRTGCPQLAADLTAETFAAAFVSRRRFWDDGKTCARVAHRDCEAQAAQRLAP
jgi:RNA polymerase sigma-70 factor (ECF subfamily)